MQKHSGSGYFLNKINTAGVLDSASGTAKPRELYRFCVSDERVNRNGWKILTMGIDYKNYLMNPVVLCGHYGLPVGKCENIFMENDKLIADIWFHELDDDSALIKAMLDEGVINSTSIGVNVTKRGTPIPIPPEEKDKYSPWQDTIDVLAGTELLEISIVPIPANSGALLIEKLNNAFGEANELRVTNWLMNKLTAYYERRPVELLNNEDNMQKDNKEAIELESIVALENSALKAENASLQAKGLEHAGLLEAANSRAAAAETKIAAYEAERTEHLNKLIEAEVKAEVARLNDKILPAEKEKLEKDLVHFKKNEATLVDSSNTSIYQLKIKEIESRNSNGYLTDKLPVADSAGDVIVNTLTGLDMTNKTDIAKADEIISKYASQNKIAYSEAFSILSKELMIQEGDNDGE